MSIDPETMAFYDAHATEYADFSDANATHASFQTFLGKLPENAKVLDFGCGTGWAAAALREAGHRADAIDASRGLAQEALARHGVEVRVTHFRTLSARSRYDAIWSNFALQHAPREDREAIFERIGTALRPGGLLYVGVQKGPVDFRDTHGRLYCPYREDEMAALLRASGFEEWEFAHGTGKMFDGKPTLNLYVWATRGA